MTTRIAGCDLGKASARFILARVGENGALTVEHEQRVFHEGEPLERFEAWYLEQRIDRCAALGATGIYAEQLQAPVRVFPEDACQQAALERELPD
jgi:hypothetical protein